MPITTRNGHRIHWQEEGAGPPLLLIMGMRLSSRLWYAAVPALAQHYRVIRFDNRGTGQSGSGWWFSVRDMADDAVAVLDAAGVASAHVYGVSMGGGIAMEMALRNPDRVRSLILGCTTIKSERSPAAKWLLAVLFYLPPWLIRRLLPSGAPNSAGSAAPPDRAARDREMVAGDPYSRRGVAAQVMAVGRYSVEKSAVARLAVPTLVLHGDEDQTVACEAGRGIAEVIPGACFEVLQGAGHNYFIAREQEANRLALDFLDEVEKDLPGHAPIKSGTALDI